jgi:hypothetical protein
MAWFPDWRARNAAIQTHGLPARVVGVRWSDELLVVELQAADAVLPRSNAARGWPLHISLLFRDEFKEELAQHAVSLHDRWSGRAVTLQVEWVGRGGGAMLLAADSLAADPDLKALHGAGYYRARQVHVSL